MTRFLGRTFATASLIFSVSLLGSPLAGATQSAGAKSSLAPVNVVYQCYSYDYSSGFSQFVQAVVLSSRSTYSVASNFKGNKLVGKSARGKYVEHGTSIKWLTGPYGAINWTAIYHLAIGTPAPGLRP
jgi:hypothetical protein